MRNLRKNVLIAITVLGLGSAALVGHAQNQNAAGEQTMSGHSGEGHHHRGGAHKSPEKMKEMMAKRQADLRDKLQLSPGQESAWQAFTATMTPAGKGARPDRAEWAKLSAPERMERMHAKMKEREARMAERVAATKTFYAALTPEQQKIFNENFMAGRRHGKTK